jgi:uncharacterized membrane protein
LVNQKDKENSFFQHSFGQTRKTILTGVLVLTPILLSIWLMFKLLAITDSIIKIFPEAVRPENLLGFGIPGLGVLLFFILVYGVGIAMRYYIGRQVVSFYESILIRVPVISSLYQATKQLMNTLFSQDGKHFREVVLVEYPRRGIFSYAFLTNELQYLDISEDELISIFLPSTPNPTTGFYLLVPKQDLYRVDLTVEDAFKLIMSAGIVAPKDIRTARPFHEGLSIPALENE